MDDKPQNVTSPPNVPERVTKTIEEIMHQFKKILHVVLEKSATFKAHILL